MEAAASVVQMTGGGGRVGMSTDMFLLPSSPYTLPPGVIVTTGSPSSGVHQYAADTLTVLRRDAWVLPVLVLSVLTMTLITTFEVTYRLIMIGGLRECFSCSLIPSRILSPSVYP